MLNTRSWLFLVCVVLLNCCSERIVEKHVTNLIRKPESLDLLKNREYLRDAARFQDSALTAEVKPQSAIDVQSYEFSGQFDWDRDLLQARVVVTLNILDRSSEQIELDNHTSAIRDVLVNQRLRPGFEVDEAAGKLRISLVGLSETERQAPVSLAIQYERFANAPSVSGIEQFDESALRAVHPRLGDPIQVRTLNTFSEPTAASHWMPCHDHPADRAIFAASFAVSPEETFIANGTLVSDTLNDQGMRVMSYRTDYSLPTYLMAFAQGEFVSASTRVGKLPIAVYARKGLPVNFTLVLEHLGTTMARFQELVGPFPFEKYAIIFLPEFGGGEEHAGITFQTELWGTDVLSAGDRSMTGHELGHQWFGDYMTVANWDDLWIKEGMATLLETESGRPYSDYNQANRLFGANFDVADGEAVIDPALPPDAKYNTGPYGRAAWIHTQLRSILGDKEYFATLRRVLKDYAFGAITTAQFLAYFEPKVGPDLTAKIRTALVAKKLPSLDVAKESHGNTSLYKVHLADPEGALVLPLDLSTYQENGRQQRFHLQQHESLVSLPATDSMLVTFDQNDQHPYRAWVKKESQDTFRELLGPRAKIPAQLFARLGAAQQEALLDQKVPWFTTPAEEKEYQATVASELGKGQLLSMTCSAAKADTNAENRKVWEELITDEFLNLPYQGLHLWYGSPVIASCGEFVDSRILAGVRAMLSRFPERTHLSPVEVFTLGLIPMPAVEAMQVFGAVARSGPSPRHKMAAIQALARYTGETPSPFALSAADTDLWKQNFRQILATSGVAEVTRSLARGLVALKDYESWPMFASAAQNVQAAREKQVLVCALYSITGAEHEGEWAAFKESLLKNADTPARTRSVLEKPDQYCKSSERR